MRTRQAGGNIPAIEAGKPIDFDHDRLLGGGRTLGPLGSELCNEDNGYCAKKSSAGRLKSCYGAQWSDVKNAEDEAYIGSETKRAGECEERREGPSASDDLDHWNDTAKDGPNYSDSAAEPVGRVCGQRRTEKNARQEGDERQDEPAFDDNVEPDSAVPIWIVASRERAEDSGKSGECYRYFC
jgi:hypothetical protein